VPDGRLESGANGKPRAATSLNSNNSSSPLNPLTVTPGCHVTLNYRISLAENGTDVVNTFGQRPASFPLGLGHLAEPLESALMGMREGERRRVELAPEQAFGSRNPDLIQRLTRSLLERSSEPGTVYEPGDLLEFPTPDGGRIAGVLKAIEGESAQVDFNHPLAGRAIVFEAEIVGILA
jgi:FKBP-type peptidyl-prolyl cis-trans isomerase SlpA